MSRRMRWAGHAARMGEERKLYKTEEERPLKTKRVWNGFNWLRTGTCSRLL
jgi:hypothetical protein